MSPGTGLGALLPPGFRDRLPPAAEAASQLVRRVVDAFAARGYERVSRTSRPRSFAR